MPFFALSFYLSLVLSLFALTSFHLYLFHFAQIILFTFGCITRIGKIFIFLIALNFAWLWLFLHFALQPHWPSAWSNNRQLVRGIVASIPERNVNSQHFLFRIEKVGNTDLKQALTVHLNWKFAPAKLKFGQQWQLPINVHAPENYANPASFDFETWSFAKRIVATGYVLNIAQENFLKAAPLSWDSIREKLFQHIAEVLKNHPNQAMITALTVGIRAGLSAADWQTLQNTGTNHLIAIAGLHIGFVATFTFLLVKFLWRRNYYLCLRIPTPIAASSAALVMAIIYSACAGFALPTTRACLMLSVAMFAIMARRHISPWTSYGCALLLILFFDPFVIGSESFYLSFVTIATIIYSRFGHIRAWPKWLSSLNMQWRLSIGLIPLTILFFQSMPLTSLLANLVAIPLVGFIILPACLLGNLAYFCHLPNAYFYLFSAKVFSWVWIILTFFAKISWLQFNLAATHFCYCLFGLIGITILFAPTGIPKRSIGILWFIPLLFYHTKPLPADELRLSYLDLKSSPAILLQTAHHQLLYNAGNKLSDTVDLGKTVIAPFLISQNIKKLNLIILGSEQNLYSGGLSSMTEMIPSAQIMTNDAHIHGPVRACQPGDHWRWDKTDFTIVTPPSAAATNCIVLVEHAGQRILLINQWDNEILKTLSLTLPMPLTVITAPPNHNRPGKRFIAASQPLAILSYKRQRHAWPHTYLGTETGMITAKFIPNKNPSFIFYRSQHFSHLLFASSTLQWYLFRPR